MLAILAVLNPGVLPLMLMLELMVEATVLAPRHVMIVVSVVVPALKDVMATIVLAFQPIVPILGSIAGVTGAGERGGR